MRYRTGPLDDIKASLQRFGQVHPILATSDGVIFGGNRVWEAAKELSWQTVMAVRFVGGEVDALALMLVGNRTEHLAMMNTAKHREAELKENLRPDRGVRRIRR